MKNIALPQLFYIIYESIETGKLSISEIEELASAARKKNFKLDVTGLLIRKNKGFIHYLEGAKNTVALLYEEILRDKRHHSLVLVTKGYTPNRKFTNWSLLLKFVTEQEINAIEGIRNTFKTLGKKTYSGYRDTDDAVSALVNSYTNYN